MTIESESSACPLSLAQRVVMLPDHPILAKDYTVHTPMIESVYEIVRERIWMRCTGIYLHARPRTGKTRCAMAIEQLLGTEFPRAYVVFLSASKEKRQSEVGLVRDLLEAQGIMPPQRTSLKVMMSYLITHIRTELGARGSNQFVLLIDEMQMLGEDAFRQLLVLHNRLELVHITMTTMGFAQPEIEHVRTSLFATNSQNLIARFLCERVPFDGCSTEEGLKAILSAYDDEKRYPEGSEWTYTRFFLQEAFDEGFRLKHAASKIWRELMKVASTFGAVSVPMAYVTRTIEFILLAVREQDKVNFVLTDEDIKVAVDASGLLNFGGVMGDTG